MNIHDELFYLILKWRVTVEISLGVPPPELLDWSYDQICYHADLLHERGLLQSYKHTWCTDRQRRLDVRIGALTWNGHDELKQMRLDRAFC